MITLITLCYLGCVYAVFKVLKVKLTSVNIGIAAIVGVFILGGIVIGWNLSSPMTQQMVVTRPVIPLVASQNSKELIKKIYVKVDQPVKKGDMLYEVDSSTLQYSLDKMNAQLSESKNKIQALEDAVAVAASKIVQARAGRDAAKADFDLNSATYKKNVGAVSRLQVEVYKFSYASARAAVDVALSSQESAKFALASARNALPATEAQLRTAQLELDRAIIRAPADGYVMNWQASEGTMTTTVASSAQGTFMDMSRTRVVAIYPQNLLRNVASGDVVEIAFKSFPNQIVTAKVDAILEYTGEGQLLTTGVLPVATTIGSKGFLAVRIILDDEEFARELPLGGAGTTAIYTDTGNPFHSITKIALRMKSLLYNLPI
jgi:membrane fusion protein (multidrug efflux system)